MKRLAPNESATCRVRAWKVTNHSEIELESGARYEFKCNLNHFWIDWFIKCDGDGYESRNTMMRKRENERRLPDANWFALVGAYGSDAGDPFLIGKENSVQATQTAELVMFANDMVSMYWNNLGYIDVVIRRV
jgi:hypothetical protein